MRGQGQRKCTGTKYISQIVFVIDLPFQRGTHECLRIFYGAIWQGCPLVLQSSGPNRCRLNWIKEMGTGPYKYIDSKSTTLQGYVRECRVQMEGNGGIKCVQSGSYHDCANAQTLRANVHVMYGIHWDNDRMVIMQRSNLVLWVIESMCPKWEHC